MDLQSAKCKGTTQSFTLTGKLKQCVSEGRYKSFKSPVSKPWRNLSLSVEREEGGGGGGDVMVAAGVSDKASQTSR